MGLFTRRTPAHERSVAEIEADLKHYRERHVLYLLTIRTLLYYMKEFSLDLTEIEADRFKECMDTLAGHFLGEEKSSWLQSILADYKDIILRISNVKKAIFTTAKASLRILLQC